MIGQGEHVAQARKVVGGDRSDADIEQTASGLEPAQVDVEIGEIIQRLLQVAQFAEFALEPVQCVLVGPTLLPGLFQPVLDGDQVFPLQRLERRPVLGQRLAQQRQQPVEVTPGAADPGAEGRAGDLRQFGIEQRPVVGGKGLEFGQHQSGARQIFTHQFERDVPHVGAGAHQAASCCNGLSATCSRPPSSP